MGGWGMPCDGEIGAGIRAFVFWALLRAPTYPLRGFPLVNPPVPSSGLSPCGSCRVLRSCSLVLTCCRMISACRPALIPVKQGQIYRHLHLILNRDNEQKEHAIKITLIIYI